jgi:hypothetical protein
MTLRRALDSFEQSASGEFRFLMTDGRSIITCSIASVVLQRQFNDFSDQLSVAALFTANRELIEKAANYKYAADTSSGTLNICEDDISHRIDFGNFGCVP